MNSLDPTPRALDECARLKRYIKALKLAHKKEIDGLLAQTRQQARQIAGLRMEAGHAVSGAGQGAKRAAARSGLKVEDIVPLKPLRPAPLVSTAAPAAPSCRRCRAG
jgi:hypothetical protein